MSFPKSFIPSARLPVLTFCSIWLLTEPLMASENYTPARVSTRAMYATVKTEVTTGTTPIRRVYVTTGTNQFAFILPEGFRLTAYSEKILLLSPDGLCSLSFRIITPTFSTLDESESAFYRRCAINQYPGANISSESSERFGPHSGPAFDLQWQNSGGGAQTARIAYIPNAAGVLEVGLVSPAARFGADQYVFNGLLASLVTNENGKLEAATPPGNT